jgi:Domain of unknown function (DUF4407)
MATEAQPRTTHGLPDTYRPARPEYRPSRLLRRFAGIREDILDWVPEERPRYTRLGIIVVNTGVLAAASMLIALSNVTSAFWGWLAPVALLWGYIICCIDGSIVAATHGVSAGKWRVYIPRLVISLLIGAFVAEPLVLWYFKPAISAEVGRQRATAEAAYEATWVHCNPPNGSPPAGCSKQYILNLPNSPADVSQELGNEKRLLSSVQGQISSIEGAIARLQYIARAECDGVGLPGGQTTGQIGQGPNCVQDRKDYASYGPDHGLPGLLALRSQYEDKIGQLTQQLAQSQAAYGSQIQQAISKQVTLWEQGVGRPGLLDEDRALQALAAQSGFVLFQEWLLRLLLIALDALPILTKWLSQTSKYDRLYTRQLDSGDRRHEKHLGVHDRRHFTELDLRHKENEFAYQDGLRGMAARDRISHGQREMELQDAIARQAAQRRAALRRDRPGQESA